MPRKNTAKSRNTAQSWKSMHHRLEFSSNNEREMVDWVKDSSFSLDDMLVRAIMADWSIKVSPMSGSDLCYVTVQNRDPNNEFGEHSWGFVWYKGLSVYAAACFVCLIMGERGDLYRDVPLTMTDVLDFMS